METRVLLIRHAQSLWNADGRWQGQADPPLSQLGEEQAALLAAELAGETLDGIVASDLARARVTAEIVGRPHGLEPVLDPRLRELDVGRWSGLRRSEIETRDAEVLARFEAGEPGARPGGGETRLEIRRRVRTAAAMLCEAHAGRTLALVTHLGVIRALWPGTEMANAQAKWWEPGEGSDQPEIGPL